MEEKKLNTMRKETLAVAVKNLLTGDKNLFGKNLFDRMEYTYKAFEKSPKSVTKKDFIDLITEASALVAPKKALAEEPSQEEPVQETPAENNVVSIKKKSKKTVENSVKEKEPVAESKPEDRKKPAKTSAKTEESSAEKPKKKVMKSLRASTSKEAEFTALMDFPTEFEEDGVKYELADGIDTIQDLHKAITDGDTLVLCFHWNKTQLKQGHYAKNLAKPKSFPNDLDVSSVLYVSDNYTVAYAISLTSEAIYGVTPDALEEIEGRRFTDGIDYQIYRVIED